MEVAGGMHGAIISATKTSEPESTDCLSWRRRRGQAAANAGAASPFLPQYVKISRLWRQPGGDTS